MKRKTKKQIAQILLGGILLAGLVMLMQLQFGYINIRQEFGVYGPYNRTLNVVGEMEDLEVVSSRLRRATTFDIPTSLKNFSIKVTNSSGQTAVVSFERDTPEFDETNRDRLKEIIRVKADAEFVDP